MIHAPHLPCLGTAAFAVGLLSAASSVAQTPDSTQAVFDRFAEDCGSVVAATDPIAQATGLDGVSGEFGQTLDGRMRQATLSYDEPITVGYDAILMVSAQHFDGGHIAQCILQIINLGEPLEGLPDLIRGGGAAILGTDDVVSAGGLVVATDLGAGLVGSGGAGAMVRVTTTEFPPRAAIHAYVLPQFVSLILVRTEADTTSEPQDEGRPEEGPTDDGLPEEGPPGDGAAEPQDPGDGAAEAQDPDEETPEADDAPPQEPDGETETAPEE